MLYLYQGTTSVCAIKARLALHVAQAVKNYDKYIGEMEGALSRSPYLVGTAYGKSKENPIENHNMATPYFIEKPLGKMGQRIMP